MPVMAINTSGKKLLSIQGFAPKKRKDQQASKAPHAAFLRFESPITPKEAKAAARNILDRAFRKEKRDFIGKDVVRVTQKLLLLGAFGCLYADRQHNEPSALSWCDVRDESTLDHALAHLAAWQPALAIGSFVKAGTLGDEEIAALQARNTALEQHNAALQARVDVAEERLEKYIMRCGNIY